MIFKIAVLPNDWKGHVYYPCTLYLIRVTLGSSITRPFWTSWMRWTTMRARGSWSLRTWWSISASSSQSTCRSSNRSARWWENERDRRRNWARLKIKHAVGQRAGKDAERGIVGMKERRWRTCHTACLRRNIWVCWGGSHILICATLSEECFGDLHKEQSMLAI